MRGLRTTTANLVKWVIGPARWQRWREGYLLSRSHWADRRENRRYRRGTPGIFVVSEGSEPHFYREFLRWLVEHDPALRSRIRLGRLPVMLPADTKVLHAWVQDPVSERSQDVFRQLTALEEQARRARARIVHPARVLSHSQRDVLFNRLSQVGVRSPRVVDVDASFADHLGGLSLPIMVRRRWGHGVSMLRLESQEAVAEWTAAEGPAVVDWIAAEYIDVRGSDGYFRKYRYVMFGARGVPRHLIVSPHWEVRPKDRLITGDTIAEEVQFVSAACDQHDRFDAARRALEFDIAAFDFSYDARGEMVVWEVNPYPSLSAPRGRPAQYLADALHRTNRLLAAFYRDELAAGAGQR